MLVTAYAEKYFRGEPTFLIFRSEKIFFYKKKRENDKKSIL